MMFSSRFFSTILAYSLLFSSTARAEEPNPFDLPLGQLNKINVTSVSKTEERGNKVAAAIFVLTQADIARSSATSVPELLRLVPGLNVARVNSNTWAISSRGFNSNFSNKLLVLVDGRSIYDPVFAGVNWDQLGILLEEIDRIEVIRGPGATVWGANAVNGVINIMTKKVKDTQGGYFTGGGGSEDQMISGARYGSKIGEDGYGRVYTSGSARDDSLRPDGTRNYDAWKFIQSGFQYDLQATPQDTVTLHGDINFGEEQSERNFPTYSPPFNVVGRKDGRLLNANLHTRWEHQYSRDSVISVQAFAITNERDVILSYAKSKTYDLEIQHSIALNETHKLTSGVGYRLIDSKVTSLNGLELVDSTFVPSSRQYDIVNGFLQDEITIIPDTFNATIGTKLEYRGYTGVMVQPGLRFAYFPTEQQTIWTAFSIANRSPAATERDLNVPAAVFPGTDGTPNLLLVKGQHDVNPESLFAYEAGYRISPSDSLSFDLSGFINHYDNLINTVSGVPTFETNPVPHLVIPSVFQSSGGGDVYGAEAAVNWAVMPSWKLQGWYAYLDMNVLDADDRSNPSHQVLLRSVTTVGKLEIDPTLRYVSSLSALNVPDYVELDLRLGYPLTNNLTLSVYGNNLLQSEHQESIPNAIITDSQIQRSVFAKVDWKF